MDKNDEQKTRLYNRRSFLSSIGVGCLGAVCLGGAVLSVEYLAPNVVLEPQLRFNAGSLDLYSPDSITQNLEHKVFIVRKSTGAIYTLSAVCTHLGCLTFFKQNEGIIACPCHGSKFNKDGEVIDGPAPRPLQRYFVELNDRSQLVIDKSQLVDENFLLKV